MKAALRVLDRLPEWLRSPAREDILDLQTVRVQLALLVNALTAFIGTPMALVAAYRNHELGQSLSALAQILAVLVLCALLIPGKKIDYRLRISVVAATMYVAALAGFMRVGFAGTAAFTVVGLSIIAALFFSLRLAIPIIITFLSGFYLIGYLFLSGTLQFEFDLGAHANEPLLWVPYLTAVTIFSVGTAWVVGWVFRSLEESIQSLKAERAHLQEKSQALSETNAQLKVAEREAKASSEAKSRFLMMISHELRTPLIPLIGFIDLMDASNEMPDELRQYLVLMKRSSQHLKGLIEDILKFKQIRSGDFELEEENVDVAQLCHDLTEMMRLRAEERRLSISCSIAPKVEGMHFLMDRKRVSQILLNLLSNAIKFTDSGFVRLNVERGEEPDQPALRFLVADSGPGVPADLWHLIIEPFTPVNHPKTRQHAGLGLGLAISQQLASKMGGNIGFCSDPGFGSTFWLELPAKRIQPQPKAAVEHRP